MPDDQNVPAGGAGQKHPARVRFASDAVREKIGDLLTDRLATKDDISLLRATSPRRMKNSLPSS